MRAALESLLRVRKLDVTLPLLGPDGEAFAPVRDAAHTAPTGVADLDLRLGGGLPRGHVSEIVGAASSGRSTLAAQALPRGPPRGPAGRARGRGAPLSSA